MSFPSSLQLSKNSIFLFADELHYAHSMIKKICICKMYRILDYTIYIIYIYIDNFICNMNIEKFENSCPTQLLYHESLNI